MAIPSVAAGAARVAPAPVQNAPAAAKSAPAPTPAAQAPATSVTISHSAKLVAAASAPPAGAATKAARAAVVRAAAATRPTTQTTTTQYVSQVRAVLARGGTANLTRIMTALGIPQAEQTQVAQALGTAPKSAT